MGLSVVVGTLAYARENEPDGEAATYLAEQFAALKIRPDLIADAEEVFEACEAQGEGTGWRRYGMETFCCLRLREGARRSIASGAALHFT